MYRMQVGQKVTICRVPVKCETKQKRNEIKRNETDRNEIKRNETKRRYISFRFVRFRFVLFDFVSFRSVSFRFDFVSHFTGTSICIHLDSCTVCRQDRKSLCDICCFSSTRFSKPPRYFSMKNNKSFILISLCQTVKTGFCVGLTSHCVNIYTL